MMVQYKNTVQKDREIPQFWVSTVTANGSDSSQPVAIFYGDSEAEARSKGNSYISAQTSRGKQVIGDGNGGSGNTYNTLDEVFRAYNECKLSFREAAAEMTRIHPSLSPNDIQNMLVDDNPTPPDCDGDGIPAGEDDDGDSSSSGSGSVLTERNRFMILGAIVIYSLRYYGRK